MEPTPPAKSTTPPPPPPLLRRFVAIDTKISQKIHILAKPFLPHSLLLLLELSADFRLFFPVALSLLLAPLLTPGPIPNPNPNSGPIHLLRPFLSPLLLGLLLDLALIGLIKFIVRRARPVYNATMSVAVSVDHFSFPSGHASRVCFVAALFYLSAAALADAVFHLRSTSPAVERWIGSDQGRTVSVLVSVVWAWAAATSISRILLGRHFVSDVFAGACLGVGEGLVAFHFLRF
ncbi:probable lipid phosphate phosphatase beta [Argentina anserina]|uniref:probable lipid phosphate phosphatase beta n=1 Tax=Argentina anserina TaxID=57926 RepID=UPI0021766445|nr:probable lipid phosphate phosphatase beta [Potentilla anserina]XP_050376665.1 probable lipid phosphate phosphatase beta [Potentilla anserina]